jgi:hypothetical protein
MCGLNHKVEKGGREGGSKEEGKEGGREGRREGGRDVPISGTAQSSPAMMKRRDVMSFNRPEYSSTEPS